MSNIRRPTSLPVLAVCLCMPLAVSLAQQQRRTTAGDGPGGLAQPTFLVHRLATDHGLLHFTRRLRHVVESQILKQVNAELTCARNIHFW